MAAASPLRWVVDFFQGYSADDEEDEMTTMESTPQTPQLQSSPPKRQRGPLVLHSGNEGGMEIRHPRTLDERMAVGMDLKQRRMVTLDLTRLHDTDARYFLEFVYGVAFALDATVEKVTDGIFLLVPRGIAVRNDAEASQTETLTSSERIIPPRVSSRSSSSRDEQEELFWQGR